MTRRLNSKVKYRLQAPSSPIFWRHLHNNLSAARRCLPWHLPTLYKTSPPLSSYLASPYQQTLTNKLSVSTWHADEQPSNRIPRLTPRCTRAQAIVHRTATPLLRPMFRWSLWKPNRICDQQQQASRISNLCCQILSTIVTRLWTNWRNLAEMRFSIQPKEIINVAPWWRYTLMDRH